jgi:hypothetical protein
LARLYCHRGALAERAVVLQGEQGGPLAIPLDVRSKIRSSGVALIILLQDLIVAALMANVGASDASTGRTLPVAGLLAAILFRLGYLPRHAPMDRQGGIAGASAYPSAAMHYRNIASPLLAAGFARGIGKMLFAVGRDAGDFWRDHCAAKLTMTRPVQRNRRVRPLMPVVIGFGCFCWPCRSLVCASVTDLPRSWPSSAPVSKWARRRFRPLEHFLTFVLIFGGGYLLTWFVKR